MKFIGKLIPRPAHPRSVRTSALNHEIWNHAVKDQAIVKRALLFLPGLFIRKFLGSFREPDEILHCLWRFLVEQLDHNVPLRSLKNGVCSCGTSHAFSLKVVAVSSYMTAVPPRH